ncbi:lipocalin-like domain-containing protein [Bradyrhizobium jicamae]|uniref:lipocalin-like domain-containing protein n=1 Tax=Bradyrhizobium jicamae TaxID=280332 RepID=UPI0009F91B88|nr:lipocalin-like domain-containing protein [Bradyrhizobium jicamae]
MDQPADTSHPLVGTWKLVSFHVETEGSDAQQLLEGWDEHPVGFVIFTKDGRLLALLTAGNRTASATPEQLIGSMCAYSGRYRVEGNRLSTIVDSAWLPAWVGTEQPRTFKRDGDNLLLMRISKSIRGFPDGTLGSY